MKKYILSFRGEFIKHKNLAIYERYLKEAEEDKEEFIDTFDKKKYKRIEEEIIKILGKIKYMAQRIPYEYAWWYQDPSFEEKYVPWMPTVDPARIETFDYNPETSQEKNITLVIDTVYNAELRNKYPTIQAYEKERKNSLAISTNNFAL